MRSIKWVLGVLVLLVLIIGLGFWAGKQKAVSESSDVASVIGTSIGFGQSLHKVSLQAPQDAFDVALDQAYSRYVSPDLITKWKADRTGAAGQLTSSPSPQSLEIVSAEKQTDGSYVVHANVLEITSKEATSGGTSSKYPVTLTLGKIKGVWMITSFEKGNASTTSTTTAQ